MITNMSEFFLKGNYYIYTNHKRVPIEIMKVYDFFCTQLTMKLKVMYYFLIMHNRSIYNP